MTCEAAALHHHPCSRQMIATSASVASSGPRSLTTRKIHWLDAEQGLRDAQVTVLKLVAYTTA